MNINYEFELGDYTYEADFNEFREAMVEILFKRVKEKERFNFGGAGAYQMAKYIVYDLDVVEDLAECLEEELRVWFWDKALKEFEERLENEREETDWYGTRGNIQ